MTPHSGWTAVPHGVWTLACTYQARLILCWLWSHNDTYRDRLSVSSVGRLLGINRHVVIRALAELEVGGLVVVENRGPGTPALIHLDADAWHSLGSRLPAIHNPGDTPN